MIILDPAHLYELSNGELVTFIKRENGQLVNEGTTNEELLEVLIDRTEVLDNKFPCDENKVALVFMKEALKAFNSRTAKRVKQGVETKDLPHVS